jgi:hypothetical protein
MDEDSQGDLRVEEIKEESKRVKKNRHGIE